MAHIRPATPDDLPAMTDLLLAGARARATRDPVLWRVSADAPYKIRASVEAAITTDTPAFRQRWLVAETAGGIAGLTHTIHLPVPPIYAGEFGPPGLIMEDCALAADAPPDLAEALIAAAEADLIAAGARILVASSVPGGPFEEALTARDYDPLTLYLSKSGLSSAGAGHVRPAVEEDVAGIVALSHECREVLYDLNPFWKPHPEADARFGAWMQKSLILPDRDMAVSGPTDGLEGYVISQPVTALHLPPGHELNGIGIIDDFHSRGLRDPSEAEGEIATALLSRGEADLAARGTVAALVICPAAWGAKRALIEDAGFRTGLVWHIKRSGRAR